MQDLATVAGKYAQQADSERRPADEVVAGIRLAGFARHFVPSSFGGDEGSFTRLLPQVCAVASECPSAGWIASLTAHTGRMAGYLPEQGQRELWHHGPDVLVSGALVPSGRATPTAGGWRVSGRWNYVSGADFADWTLVCTQAESGAGPQSWCLAIPRADYATEDTWFNVGMRATGSNTVVVDDLFVPRHRSFPRADLEAGLSDGRASSCYRAPLRAVNGLSFVVPLLGAAQGMAGHWIDWIGRKTDTHTGTRTRDRQSVQSDLAHSTAEIAAAELLVHSIAERADSGAGLRPYIALHMRDWSFAGELLKSAAQRIFQASGTSGQHENAPVQRFWRDIHSAASHFALQLTQAAGPYAEETFRGETACRSNETT
ncbi:acyl-CoA dehydrogenase family protein [Streptomyces sp. NPDC058773]|uniref:acyl-CoA dehydrogenase family protein n=1 Tax=Streptomyces sp. NPDC058773 TaxID=3346632 RepID=UPI0036860F86